VKPGRKEGLRGNERKGIICIHEGEGEKKGKLE
jgi:hypothetical protein